MPKSTRIIMPFKPKANQAIRSRLTKFQSNRSEISVDISWLTQQTNRPQTDRLRTHAIPQYLAENPPGTKILLMNKSNKITKENASRRYQRPSFAHLHLVEEIPNSSNLGKISKRKRKSIPYQSTTKKGIFIFDSPSRP